MDESAPIVHKVTVQMVEFSDDELYMSTHGLKVQNTKPELPAQQGQPECNQLQPQTDEVEQETLEWPTFKKGLLKGYGAPSQGTIVGPGGNALLFRNKKSTEVLCKATINGEQQICSRRELKTLFP